MSKKKKTHEESGFETVEHALTKTEQYVEENKKSLSIILAVILGIVVVYMAYNKFILKPQETEAQSQIFRAEQYFEKDSFLLALEGDGDAYGFIDIIDEYGITNTANLAQYYAGICYLHLGDYEQAIEHLKKFDANDKIVSLVAMGAIGDAYVELDDLEEAISFYEEATSKHKNEFITAIYLKKLALVYEETDNYKKALAAYEKIKKEFPNSEEARDIDKYIEAAKMKL